MKHRKLFTKREDALIKALLVTTLFSGIAFGQIKINRVRAEMIDPSGMSMNLITVEDKENKTKPTVEEVKDYLKVIFGSQWKLAWAVAEAECNHTRREWPYCVNSWEAERSIGMFQINIAKNNGLGAKVHWDKIPGKNLKEKELYLSDWRNNILIAHVIYSQSGFYPWTGYTSGNYLVHLK